MAHYIDKDALVAELKERIKNYWSDTENAMGIYPYALEEVIKYANTLEVKEVDLEKEMSNYLDTYYKDAKIGYKLSIRRTAKHFFELGLKAKQE